VKSLERRLAGGHPARLAGHQPREYVPRKEMAPDGGYPIVLGYRDGTALGYHYGFADPLHLYRLDISLAASVDGIQPSTRSCTPRSISAPSTGMRATWHNYADFYDLFGPTKRSRKGDAIGLEYNKLLVYDDPRRLEWHAKLVYFSGLDTLPFNQNVNDIIDSLVSGEVGLKYSNTRKSQASVDHEKGFDWRSTALRRGQRAHLSQVRRQLRHRRRAAARELVAVAVQLGRHRRRRRRRQPRQLLFRRLPQQLRGQPRGQALREYETFPGFEIDALGGQRFSRNMLEWNAPPMRFETSACPASTCRTSGRPCSSAAW
jgi:hypothetical protein